MTDQILPYPGQPPMIDRITGLKERIGRHQRQRLREDVMRLLDDGRPEIGLYIDGASVTRSARMRFEEARHLAKTLGRAYRVHGYAFASYGKTTVRGTGSWQHLPHIDGERLAAFAERAAPMRAHVLYGEGLRFPILDLREPFRWYIVHPDGDEGWRGRTLPTANEMTLRDALAGRLARALADGCAV